MSKENKGRIRHVCKFGKNGKFAAYDGRPDGKEFLEPFIELSAFDKCQAENRSLEQRLAEAISDAEKLVAALKQYEAIHLGRLNDDSFMKVENPARKAVNEWKEKYRG